MINKYPYLFNDEYQYIVGSIENKVERIRDDLRTSDVEMLRWIEGRPSSKYASKQELTDYRNELEHEINELSELLKSINEAQG